METNCKECGHSVFDHSDDIGCDAKGCTCSLGFEFVVDVIFSELADEINWLRVENERLKYQISGLTQRALDDAEVCDCGEPFPENGECKFCGARARHRQ